MALIINLSRRDGRNRLRVATPDGRVVWLTLLDARAGQARLAVEADRDVVVKRESLLPEEERFGAKVVTRD